MTAAPTADATTSIAVIGAGMAGATLAADLAARGLTVQVFDKGRGPGGRMATRRLARGGEEVRFDHGAQYFTAGDPDFRDSVEGWRAAGVVRPWAPRLVGIGRDGTEPVPQPGDADARFVGVPAMSTVLRHLTRGLAVSWGVEIAGVTREGTGWRLRDKDGADHGLHDRVLFAIPPAQARPRLPSGLFTHAVDQVEMAPCFAAMVPVEAAGRDPGFDAAFVADGGPLAWIARQGAKPDRAADGWVMHATPDWTRAHLDADRADVASALADHLGRLLGDGDLDRSAVTVHRWLYARTETPLGQPCLYDAAAGIGLAGDWCLGAKVEAAFLSGRALARRVVADR